MAYDNTGSYELRINYVPRCVKNWLRLFDMDNGRFADQVYKIMLCYSNSCDWAGKIDELLLRFNSIDVWEAQSADDY